MWRYIGVGGFGLEPCLVGGVLPVAGSLWPLDVDLVGLEGLSISGLAVKRGVVLLVGIMLLGGVVLGPFGFVLLAIGGFSLETACARSVLVLAGRGSLYYYPAGDVFLLVLGGVVELGSIRLVGITRMDLCGWACEGLVIGAIGGLE